MRTLGVGLVSRGLFARWGGGWLLVLGLIATFTFAERLSADEPAIEFLEALRQDKLYDLAFAYLDQMETSPLVSEEFRASIPLERAETMIQSTSQSRDLKFWEERLAAAEKLLSDYASHAPNEEYALRAQQSLANLRFRQARVYVMRSESDRLTAEEKKVALDRARLLLQDCLSSFEQARENLKAKIVKLTAAAGSDPKAAEELEPLRNGYTQVRLRTPMARELLADTFPPDSSERKQALELAAKEFQDVWDDYGRYAAGLEACLSAARCLNRVGKSQDGVFLLEDIFNQADTPSFRKVKVAAALIAVDCWNSQTPFPFKAVVDRLEPLIGSMARDEQRQNDWLKLQFALARAYMSQADDMQANNQSPGDVSRVKRSAAMLLRVVSRNPSDVRESARELMEKSNLDLPPETASTQGAAIATLGDALQRAMDIASEIETQYSSWLEQDELATKGDPQQQSTAQAAAKEIEAALTESIAELQRTLRSGLAMADSETSVEQLNHIRYLQTYGHFVAQQFYEAGLIGEFLLDKYPNVEWSRQSAGLSVNAYAKLFGAPEAEVKSFARQHLMALEKTLVERWPGSSEANSAAAVMTRLALSEKDFESAKRHFQSIGSDSAAKAPLSQQLGQQNWENYRLERSKMSAEELSSRREEMAAKLDAARLTLEQGVAGLGPDEITFEAAVTALLLVNAQLESGNLPAAIEQLENAAVAPLDLIKQKHPAIMNSPKSQQFISETYRTAINVYLSNMKTGTDSATLITKAQNVLTALKQNLESRPGVNANEEMVAIYGLIASELRNQFQALTDATQKINLAKNLLAFLGQLQQSSSDAKTIMWIGATLLDTAKTLPGNDPNSAALARELSDSAWQALLAAEKAGFGSDPKAAARMTELARLKAVALAGQGKFGDAIKQYGEILAAKPSVLPIQIDAALTLERWALETKSPSTYKLAVGGTDQRRNPDTKRMQNTIWGWRQLVLATRGKEEFKEEFCNAIYHLIDCRIEYGKLANESDVLKTAQQELENARGRDPEFGGTSWKEKFNALEQKLKQHLGK